MTHPQRMRTFTHEISRLDDDLGAVYMRAGTGHLPGRDVTRDPGMYMFL